MKKISKKSEKIVAKSKSSSMKKNSKPVSASNGGGLINQKMKKLQKTSTRKDQRSSSKNPKTTKSISTMNADAHAEDVETLPLDGEDLEFFEEHAKYSAFLTEMKVDALSSSVKKGKVERMERKVLEKKKDVVEEAEAKPRRAFVPEKDLSNKLLVKASDGSMQVNTILEEISREQVHVNEREGRKSEKKRDDMKDETDSEVNDDDVSDIEMEEIANEDAAAPDFLVPTQSKADLRLLQMQRLKQKKIEIAMLSESILENPEDALKKCKEHPEGLSKMQQLHQLCEDSDSMVCKLALVSMLTVFLDILPGYRIRLPTEADVQMKKTVQKLRDFEASLLSSYQKFLKLLDATAKPAKNTTELGASESNHHLISTTAVKCLAALMKAKYAFNFSVNLIRAILPFADASSAEIRDVAAEAIEAVFRDDLSCEVCFEIVKQMSVYVKKKNNKVQCRLIQTLIKMPLKTTMEAGENAKRAAKNERKRRRKLQSEGDSIATGLKEAEATVDKNERARFQGEILHELVLIYFRILKDTSNSNLMPDVLKGLSKYAHLINLDIMIDLMKVLKELLKLDTLPFPTALQAVLTGLRTLQGPGQVLMVDEKDFVNSLYKLLITFAEGNHDDSFPVALTCLEAVFLRRKEIMVDRVAAFAKRLLLISLHLKPNQTLALLSLVRRLLHKYPKLHQILDSESDRVASGLYRGDIDDPDFSNPYASSCWELSMLRCHVHPTVASFALGTATMEPCLPNELPETLLEAFDVSFGEIKPALVIPRPNPLHNRLKENKSGRKRKIRSVFVATPLTESTFLQRLYQEEDRLNEMCTFQKPKSNSV